MTLRARPTTKPATRARHSPGNDHRRNLYMNIGFGAVVVVAVLLFGGAAFAGWYSQHLAPAATVNGVTITKDQVAQRQKIEEFRLKVWEDTTRAQANAGHMAGSTAQSVISYIDQLRQSLATNSLGYEEDSELVRQLAVKRNITISDADVDTQLTKDATTPETRHVFAITIKPEVSTAATTSTDVQKQAAKTKADALLAGLKSGTSWEDTVKASGDPDAATGNGDLYFIGKDTTTPDQAFVKAIFDLTAAGYTEVIPGSDGAYRIGRMTEIAPASVDKDFANKISAFGVDIGAYRNLDRSYIAHDRIDSQLQAEVVTSPSEQRKVTQIVLETNGGQPAPAGAILVRQILYAPNDAPTTAKDLKADDPAWAKAKQEAADAVAKLKAGTARFVDLVVTSDDVSSATNNGFLSFYTKDTIPSTVDPAVATAIFTPGLTSGQLLDPVLGADGWHVIQVVTTDTPENYVKTVAAAAAKPGADIASLAAQYSIETSSAKGGDMGWIAKYQLAMSEQQQIFALLNGGVSNPVEFTGSDGYSVYTRFYVVTDVQTRLPDDTQKATLTSAAGGAFSNWYTAVRADPTQANIVEADAGAPVASP